MARLAPYGQMARVLYRLPTLVEDARRARGLSQAAAGEQAGVSKNVIQRLETGAEVVAVDTLIRVLYWLDQT